MAQLDFNSWANHVQFGIKCDRENYNFFIEKYENATYLQTIINKKNSVCFNNDSEHNIVSGGNLFIISINKTIEFIQTKLISYLE